MGKIRPIYSAHSFEDWQLFDHSEIYQKHAFNVNHIISKHKHANYSLRGYCAACNCLSNFLVDMNWGGRIVNGEYVPNFRERLVCQFCNLNNRQRLGIAIIKNIVSDNKLKIYFMEQVTDYFNFAKKILNKCDIVGSEYISDSLKSGTIQNNIRHEDCESLSFRDNSFDLIVSNDVFEHIPNFKKSFSECYRVLKKDGEFLFTIPFNANYKESKIRASIDEGRLVHFQEPEFHGNPMSEKGSLVFTDFGWDVLKSLRDVGFKDSRVEIYQNPFLGHITLQLIFRCKK